MADSISLQRDRVVRQQLMQQRLQQAAEAQQRAAIMQQSLQAERERRAQMEQAQFGRATSQDQFRNEMAWRQYKEGQNRFRAEMGARASEQAGRREQAAAAERKERLRLQGMHAQDLSNLEAINSSVQNLIGRMGSIQRPSNKAGFQHNFGMIPEIATRYLPGAPYNTKVELDQLEDLAKASGLSNIKAQSGSIGTITEREWPIIASQVLKLNVGQTEDAARGMLGTARRNLLNMRNRELREYQNKWRDTPFYKDQPFSVPPVETQGKGAGIPKTFAHGQEIWDNLTPEEKALWLPGMEKQ